MSGALDHVGFAAVRRPAGRGFVVVVVDDAGARVATLGGDRAARAAAAVVLCWIDADGVAHSSATALRQHIASAHSLARAAERAYRSLAPVAVVVPVIELADFDPMAPVYVYVGGGQS